MIGLDFFESPSLSGLFESSATSSLLLASVLSSIDDELENPRVVGRLLNDIKDEGERVGDAVFHGAPVILIFLISCMHCICLSLSSLASSIFVLNSSSLTSSAIDFCLVIEAWNQVPIVNTSSFHVLLFMINK